MISYCNEVDMNMASKMAVVARVLTARTLPLNIYGCKHVHWTYLY